MEADNFESMIQRVRLRFQSRWYSVTKYISNTTQNHILLPMMIGAQHSINLTSLKRC